MNRLQMTSPAVTLELKPQNEEEDVLSLDIVPALEVPQGWPQAARAGPDIDRWLGKRCRRNFTSKAVYFVPKGPKAKNLKDEAKGAYIQPHSTFLFACMIDISRFIGYRELADILLSHRERDDPVSWQ